MVTLGNHVDTIIQAAVALRKHHVQRLEFWGQKLGSHYFILQDESLFLIKDFSPVLLNSKPVSNFQVI